MIDPSVIGRGRQDDYDRFSGTPPGSPRGSGSRRVSRALAGALVLTAVASGVGAQQSVPRIAQQDSTLDNLQTPAGSETSRLGSLGGVLRRGGGPGKMLLIPGLGFGGDVFVPLMEALGDSWAAWAVTLPGFAGTPAPPMPAEGTSYGAQTWTSGAYAGIEALVEREDLRDLVIVGHWLAGTQLALRLAAEHPERVRAVVLISGSARFTQAGAEPRPLEQQVAYVDRGLAPRWFRTVTRETWDDNNFLPGDYAAHPVLGLRLWREAARPPLYVWIRYLCEYYAQDPQAHISALAAPLLRLDPGLEGLWFDPANPYLEGFTRGSWTGLSAPDMTVIQVPGTRAVPWADRPAEVARAILDFVGRRP